MLLYCSKGNSSDRIKIKWGVSNEKSRLYTMQYKISYNMENKISSKNIMGKYSAKM